MKKVLSLALGALLMVGAVSTAFAEQGTPRPITVVAESGFENGLEAPFYANTNDGGQKADITVVEGTAAANSYLTISNRDETQRAATAQHNVKAQMIANGANGKYYISAKVRLENENDSAYILPFIQTNKFQLQTGGGTRFAVDSDWKEIGKTSSGDYMSFGVIDGAFTADNLTSMSYAKFYFLIYKNESGGELYAGDYSIDDVVLWFVPSTEISVEKPETGILSDPSFSQYAATPNTYDVLFGGDNTWYNASKGGSGAAKDRICDLTITTEAANPKADVYSGSKALHITNRPGAHQSIAVDVKTLIDNAGSLIEGEGFGISVWMRAEEGETIEVMPIFFAADGGNGFINRANYITVGDEWTQVGLTDGIPNLFKKGEGEGTFWNPFGTASAHIRLRTKDDKSFYVDDFKVYGVEKNDDPVDSFVSSVNALPNPSEITRAHEGTITLLEETYASFDLDTLTENQKSELSSAKAKLDAVRAAFNLLPAPKNSFVPVFTYENKANLIAPYGDLETFTENDYVWNEENVEGENPKYTLINDAKIAHGGSKALLISNRTKSQHSASFTVTEVVKSQGGGKYYFSAWMRTKNPGEEMDVFPLLYVGGKNMEFYINGDERYTITNEWTYVGVTYDNLEGYYRSNGQEMPDLDDSATYVALRFYGQNETLADETEGVMYPDYYIDDLKFWKAFDGQADYVDPDAPKPVDPTPSVPSTPGTDDSKNPVTGDPVGLLVPALLAVSAAGTVFFGRRKRK